MRIEAQDYHAVASAAPELAVDVGALARKRIGGLQEVTAEPAQPRALVMGHRGDPGCLELRRFLDRNQITFELITPDVMDAAEHSNGTLPPETDWPAVRVPD